MRKRCKDAVQRVLRGNGTLEAIAKTARCAPGSVVRFALQLLAEREESHRGKARALAKAWFANPAQIPLVHVQREATALLEEEVVDGPHVAVAQREMGEAFEHMLETQLRRMGVPFSTETELRDEGRAKTPDILLAVPVAVEVAGEMRTVTWIDSKAFFGSESAFRRSAEQFRGYVARYGRGLVIFWFGHVASLRDADEHRLAADVTVSDRLPASVAHLASAPVAPRPVEESGTPPSTPPRPKRS